MNKDDNLRCVIFFFFFLCPIPTNKTGQIDLLKIAQTPVASAGCPLTSHGHNAIYTPLNICGISDEETSFWTICHMTYMRIMLIMKIQTKAIHFTQSSILTHLFFLKSCCLLFFLFLIQHISWSASCFLKTYVEYLISLFSLNINHRGPFGQQTAGFYPPLWVMVRHAFLNVLSVLFKNPCAYLQLMSRQ